VVEHSLGKGEVARSIRAMGTMNQALPNVIHGEAANGKAAKTGKAG
jgi:hypothetical protein